MAHRFEPQRKDLLPITSIHYRETRIYPRYKWPRTHSTFRRILQYSSLRLYPPSDHLVLYDWSLRLRNLVNRIVRDYENHIVEPGQRLPEIYHVLQYSDSERKGIGR